MFHPFQFVPVRWRAALLWFLGLGTAALMALVVWTDQPLHIAAAPQGIVNLEVAGTAERAGRIIAAWEAAHPEAPRIDTMEGVVQQVPHGAYHVAADNILVDFPFLVFYGLLLTAVCGFVAEGGAGAKVVGVLGWLMPLAMLADTVENTLMFRELNGDVSLAGATLVCALVKFAIALSTLGVLGWALWVRGWRAASVVAGVVFVGLAAGLVPALVR